VSAFEKISSHLENAIQATSSLQLTLEKEFESLKTQDLETFQNVQPEKISLLKSLQLFDQQKNKFLLSQSQNPDQAVELEKLLPEPDGKKWLIFLEGLKKCDELHRKVDFYLTQKIKTTNAILDILQINKSHNATQLYDAYGNNKLSTIGNKITEA
jgi:flagellar biosynthesis/type III secretory pathway chaperone